MQKWIKQFGWTGMLALALSAPAAGGTLYKWTNADGTVSFTDDLKRVPEAFRNQAKTVTTKKLNQYERYTPHQKNVQPDHEAQLQARLERLRAFNAQELPAVSAAGPVSQTVVRLNNRMSISIPNEETAASDEPIIVEERRVRDPNAIATRHVTVVKQGDRIISVIRPKSTHSNMVWGDEEELFPDAD